MAFTFSGLGQVTLNARPLKTKLPEHSAVECLLTGFMYYLSYYNLKKANGENRDRTQNRSPSSVLHTFFLVGHEHGLVAR